MTSGPNFAMPGGEELNALADDAFLAAFEKLYLPPDRFGHPEHLRLAYCYLRRYEFTEALHRIKMGLVRFATALGSADRYHETVTVAFVALVNERMAEDDCGGDWRGFLRDNPDLLGREGLAGHYGQDLLASELARRVFLLPRRRDAGR